MKVSKWSYGLLAVFCAFSLSLTACKDDKKPTPAKDAGEDSGQVSKDSGVVDSGKTDVDSGVAACVAASKATLKGVTSVCKECMCANDPVNSPKCGDLCWSLSNCVYMQCQAPSAPHKGLDATTCSTTYCTRYLSDSEQNNASTALGQNGAFMACGAGECVGFWTMSVPIDPPKGNDAGTDDAGDAN